MTLCRTTRVTQPCQVTERGPALHPPLHGGESVFNPQGCTTLKRCANHCADPKRSSQEQVFSPSSDKRSGERTAGRTHSRSTQRSGGLVGRGSGGGGHSPQGRPDAAARPRTVTDTCNVPDPRESHATDTTVHQRNTTRTCGDVRIHIHTYT